MEFETGSQFFSQQRLALLFARRLMAITDGQYGTELTALVDGRRLSDEMSSPLDIVAAGYSLSKDKTRPSVGIVMTTSCIILLEEPASQVSFYSSAMFPNIRRVPLERLRAVLDVQHKKRPLARNAVIDLTLETIDEKPIHLVNVVPQQAPLAIIAKFHSWKT